MCKDNETGAVDFNEIRKFNRYLVFHDGTEGVFGIKGIRSDAPDEIIDEFIGWYRRKNRYDNGRLRPEGTVRKSLIIPA